jgi:UDP-N-acetyl-D-mannosaminuronate dehydrogenase
VVILTDHSGLPYDSLLRSARLVVDTRNVLRGERAPGIVRL